MSFRYCNGFLLRVYDKDAAGHTLHVLDTAKVSFQLVAFLKHLGNFLLGEVFQFSATFHSVDLVESFDTRFDGLVVGKSTAEPTIVHVVHAATLSFRLDGFLSLLFGADKQDGLALSSDVTYECVCDFGLSNRLLKVDDVNIVTLCVDILFHFGVPSSCLVTEVYTAFKKLFHRYNCHFSFLLKLFMFLTSSRRQLRPPPRRQISAHGANLARMRIKPNRLYHIAAYFATIFLCNFCNNKEIFR